VKLKKLLKNGGEFMDLNSNFCQDDIEKNVKIIEEACEELEKKRNANIILLLMAEEWASLERETIDDLYFYLKERELKEKNNIEVILQSSGGDADATYHLSVILDSKAKELKLNFIVPRMAKSAATLLACSGDSIIMTDLSELGPIDPQIQTRTGRWISSSTVRDALSEIFKMLERRANLSDKCLDALFRTLPITEVGQFGKLTEYIKELLTNVLRKRMFKEADNNTISNICKELTEGYKYHGMPISRWEAERIGLKVEKLKQDEEEIILSKIYKPFRNLVNNLEKSLLPILTVLPLPIVTATPLKTKFGILYLPPTELIEMLKEDLKEMKKAKS
jgi:pantothenate kinase-related protein Tda10